MNKILILIITFIGLCPGIWAQPFSFDTTFNLQYPFWNGNGDINGIIEHEDGKFVIYGDFSTDFNSYPNFVRFHASGGIDHMFKVYYDNLRMVDTTEYGYFLFGFGTIDKINYSGKTVDSAYYNNVMVSVNSAVFTSSINVYRYPDHRIMGSCPQCSFNGSPLDYFYLYRLNSDGTYDTTFQNRSAPDGPIYQFVKYDATRLMVWGHFSNYDGHPMYRVARIDTAGYIDTTFKSIFIIGGPKVAHVQPDGKIIVTGGFVIENNPDTLGIVRLMPDGSLDPTFNNQAIPKFFGSGAPSPRAICPTTDGGYLMGGSFNKYDGYPRGNIVKTDANGFIDTAYFNHSGVDSSRWGSEFPLPFIRKIYYSSKHDKYYVMGDFNRYNGKEVQPIIRLNGLSVGKEEPEKRELQFSIYPNPAGNILLLHSDNHIRAGMIRITDINGKLIEERTINGEANTIEFDLSNLSPGIYIVGIIEKGTASYRKFVKL